MSTRNFELEVDLMRSVVCAGGLGDQFMSPAPMHGGPWYYDFNTKEWTDKIPTATACCASIPQFKTITVTL